jgi:hypothetical protein
VLGYRTITLAAALSAALLTACGGGGGGDALDTPTGNAMAFPLQAGYKALISNGYSIDFIVSGSCSGTASQVNGKAQAATFEGTAGVAAVSTQTIDFGDCTPSHTVASETEYFDASYASLGSSVENDEYGVYEAPASFPVSVKVGDSGSYGTEILYGDSSKAQVTGRAVRTWRVDADTASTAIGTLTTQVFDAANQLDNTQQSRYRLAADGTLTILGVDIQVAGTNGLHLVLTPK